MLLLLLLLLPLLPLPLMMMMHLMLLPTCSRIHLAHEEAKNAIQHPGGTASRVPRIEEEEEEEERERERESVSGA